MGIKLVYPELGAETLFYRLTRPISSRPLPSHSASPFPFPFPSLPALPSPDSQSPVGVDGRRRQLRSSYPASPGTSREPLWPSTRAGRGGRDLTLTVSPTSGGRSAPTTAVSPGNSPTVWYLQSATEAEGAERRWWRFPHNSWSIGASPSL